MAGFALDEADGTSLAFCSRRPVRKQRPTTRRTQMFSIRRLGLIAIVFGLLGLGAAVVRSGPSQELETYYYSNAAHTNLVGYRDQLCGGGLLHWGQVTTFAVHYSYPCN